MSLKRKLAFSKGNLNIQYLLAIAYLFLGKERQYIDFYGSFYSLKQETLFVSSTFYDCFPYRLFWAITLILSSGCLYLLLGRVLRVGVEVNFTPNTLYLSWNTVFPAVTVLETYNVKTTQKKLAARYRNFF